MRLLRPTRPPTTPGTQPAKKAPTASEIQHFKASRRAALARVASQKQKELARKHNAECSAEEERRQKDAEVALRADELRSVAVARAGSVAAQKRHREREVELSRRAEARAKRERVAAVLAYDETQADEHEIRMRRETARRIHREGRRRELALQRQEDERMERMRLYEGGGRYDIAPVAPVVETARSFFSISGSAVREWEWGNDEIIFSSIMPRCNLSACSLRRKNVFLHADTHRYSQYHVFENKREVG